MASTFPPPPVPTATAVLLHVALLLLAIASVVGLFIKSRRRARARDLFLWAAAIVLATVWCALGSCSSEAYRPFLIGYMLFVWTIAGTGCFLSGVRLSRQGQGTLVALTLGPLLALGFLIGLMLPRVPSAREAARRTQCRNNIHEIMMAIHAWRDAEGRFPDARFGAPDQPPRSWRVALLPFLSGAPLRDRYNDALAWDHGNNLPIARTRVPTLLCPSNPNDTSPDGLIYTPYVLVTGPRTMFVEGHGLAVDSAARGQATTITLAEAAGLNIVWTRPWDVDAEREPTGVNLPGTNPRHSPGVLSSYHEGGAYVGMADGRVSFLSERMDPAILEALLDRDRSETVADRF